LQTLTQRTDVSRLPRTRAHRKGKRCCAQFGHNTDALRAVIEKTPSTNVGVQTVLKLIIQLVRNESGTTALEYGIMAGLIAGVIITTVTTTGGDLDGVFGAINAALAAVPGA